MAKKTRTRRHRTRRMRGGVNGNNTNNNTNNNNNNNFTRAKEREAQIAEPFKLIDSLVEALETDDTETLSIYITIPEYKKILLEALEHYRKQLPIA